MSLLDASFLDAIENVVDPKRIYRDPIELSEDGKGNTCAPIAVSHRGNHWALRLKDDDFHRVLVGSQDDPSKSYRRLPDYIIFVDPHRGKKRRPATLTLQILVCELKSSDTGAFAATRQVQLGKFLAEYLVRLAAFSIGDAKLCPELDIRGLIASPFPKRFRARGMTRADGDDGAWTLDVPSDMVIHRIDSGESEGVRIEEFFD